MGKVRQGITNPVTGKVGNLVFSSWKGIPYVKTKPAVVHNPRTPQQQSGRKAFAVIQGLVAGLPDLVRAGFAARAFQQSAYNAAISHNLTNAVVVEGNSRTVNFRALTFSLGTYAPVTDCVVASADEEIIVRWNPAVIPGVIAGHSNDPVGIIVVSGQRNRPLWLPDAARRADGQFIFSLPVEWSGSRIYVWTVTRSATLKSRPEASVSSSVYAGETGGSSLSA
ncbi:MAG TPA: DUF6266 family protein [Lentimicrobium sp.]|nr:DUF6266 family protein [Lentimicrobium sp.]